MDTEIEIDRTLSDEERRKAQRIRLAIVVGILSALIPAVWLATSVPVMAVPLFAAVSFIVGKWWTWVVRPERAWLSYQARLERARQIDAGRSSTERKIIGAAFIAVAVVLAYGLYHSGLRDVVLELFG